jgi:hypothetical protein
MSSAVKSLKKVVKKVGGATLDVVTLGQSETIKGVAKGVTGIAAAEAAKDAAAVAAKTAAQQKADIAKQEKLIADEQKKQDKVAAERAGRLAQNLLLSGSETGGVKGSLLRRA